MVAILTVITLAQVFVDAYWNSRQQSFAQHLISMMTSWAVVCDVWFMDQQVRVVMRGAAVFACFDAAFLCGWNCRAELSFCCVSSCMLFCSVRCLDYQYFCMHYPCK